MYQLLGSCDQSNNVFKILRAKYRCVYSITYASMVMLFTTQEARPAKEANESFFGDKLYYQKMYTDLSASILNP